ncbi:cob(I)yrinic acid a,c-diamide adenosyltransferase [Candidatus Magnetoovum chiemensis]|nr:cob(I)yrinic acid a,c-diamide adenosyltransferase [Candidatus Magnetoovum chiemensis]
MTKGLLIVFTGNGKGKTTAALGLALRAAGHDMKVCIIQFIKGSWKYGEMSSLEKFKGAVDLHIMGKGFTWKSKDLNEDISMAKNAWDFASDTIVSAKYDMVILDELTYVINYKMVDEQAVLKTLINRPKDVHVVVTGRKAPISLIEASDIATEMTEIKHPYKNGVKAQAGIEF